MRLGHEAHLAHVSPLRLVKHVMEITVFEILPGSFVAISGKNVRKWWFQRAELHDHRTCGSCSTEVW